MSVTPRTAPGMYIVSITNRNNARHEIRPRYSEHNIAVGIPLPLLSPCSYLSLSLSSTHIWEIFFVYVYLFRCLSPQANYTDRATASCRQS
jgi:hypothetical protein